MFRLELGLFYYQRSPNTETLQTAGSSQEHQQQSPSGNPFLKQAPFHHFDPRQMLADKTSKCRQIHRQFTCRHSPTQSLRLNRLYQIRRDENLGFHLRHRIQNPFRCRILFRWRIIRKKLQVMVQEIQCYFFKRWRQQVMIQIDLCFFYVLNYSLWAVKEHL